MSQRLHFLALLLKHKLKNIVSKILLIDICIYFKENREMSHVATRTKNINNNKKFELQNMDFALQGAFASFKFFTQYVQRPYLYAFSALEGVVQLRENIRLSGCGYWPSDASRERRVIRDHYFSVIKNVFVTKLYERNKRHLS